MKRREGGGGKRTNFNLRRREGDATENPSYVPDIVHEKPSIIKTMGYQKFLIQ